MIDWTKSMQQTYEYYIVDPLSWKDVKRINTVISSNIKRDADSETLGSASFDVTESLGEVYVRTYLIAIQNGVTERIPLGVHLLQTPSSSFNGKVDKVSVDAYTPLIELKEKNLPIGFSVMKDTNILNSAYTLIKDHQRGPVIPTTNEKTLYNDFVADNDENYLSFVTDMIANAKHNLGLDNLGRVIFMPKQEIDAMSPVWTYTDDNSSILTPDYTCDHDLYGVPNVVEVIYSDGSNSYRGLAKNEDPDSPTSIQSRGREINRRITDVSAIGDPTADQIQAYAERVLKELSTLEYTISYTHGYCPVRVGDCIRFDYNRSGVSNVKAKVISQDIDCGTGCTVTETAVFTKKLWR